MCQGFRSPWDIKQILEPRTCSRCKHLSHANETFRQGPQPSAVAVYARVRCYIDGYAHVHMGHAFCLLHSCMHPGFHDSLKASLFMLGGPSAPASAAASRSRETSMLVSCSAAWNSALTSNRKPEDPRGTEAKIAHSRDAGAPLLIRVRQTPGLQANSSHKWHEPGWATLLTPRIKQASPPVPWSQAFMQGPSMGISVSGYLCLHQKLSIIVTPGNRKSTLVLRCFPPCRGAEGAAAAAPAPLKASRAARRHRARLLKVASFGKSKDCALRSVLRQSSCSGVLLRGLLCFGLQSSPKPITAATGKGLWPCCPTSTM